MSIVLSPLMKKPLGDLHRLIERGEADKKMLKVTMYSSKDIHSHVLRGSLEIPGQNF